MVGDSNESELKIVDFGLSKILGPSETSTDPFGTLSYVAPEVLL
jgi:serine/threonine protein kinase